MATTAGDIINAALARASANRPELLTTAETELLLELWRQMREVYALAARENPQFFAAVLFAPQEQVGDFFGWAKPQNGIVFQIRATADTKDSSNFTVPNGKIVRPIPFTDTGETSVSSPAFPATEAAVGDIGQVYLPLITSFWPYTGHLNIYYSSDAPQPTTLASNLDPRWPESFNPILIAGLAEFLARKDGARNDEADNFAAEKDRWANTFTQYLYDQQMHTLQRFRPFRRIGTTATRNQTPSE